MRYPLSLTECIWPLYIPMGSSNILYFKGSPEVILRICRYQLTEGGVHPIEADSDITESGRNGQTRSAFNRHGLQESTFGAKDD